MKWGVLVLLSSALSIYFVQDSSALRGSIHGAGGVYLGGPRGLGRSTLGNVQRGTSDTPKARGLGDSGVASSGKVSERRSDASGGRDNDDDVRPPPSPDAAAAAAAAATRHNPYYISPCGPPFSRPCPR